MAEHKFSNGIDVYGDILHNGEDQLIFDRDLTAPTTFARSFAGAPTIRRGRGACTVDAIDVASDPSDTGDYFVDPVFGDDADAGDEANPLKTVTAAIAKSDFGRVFLAPGIYGFSDMPSSTQWAALGTTYSYHIRKWAERRPGEVYITSHRASGSWAAYGAISTLWERTVTGSTCEHVVDLSRQMNDGSYYNYVRVASAADCALLPGSWYDAGATVVVNTFDGLAPGLDLLLLFGQSPLNIGTKTAGANAVRHEIYLDQITVISGFHGVYNANGTGTNGGKFVASRCKFVNCKEAGAQFHGVKDVFLEDCTFAGNLEDGVDYFGAGVSNAQLVNAMEVRCRGGNNGSETTNDTGNTSSGHNGCEVIRIGCDYFGGDKGPTIQDITGTGNPGGTKSKAWLVDCRLGRSASTDAGSQNASYSLDEGTAHLYLCDLYGSEKHIVQANSGVVYVDRTRYVTSNTAPTAYKQL